MSKDNIHYDVSVEEKSVKRIVSQRIAMTVTVEFHDVRRPRLSHGSPHPYHSLAKHWIEAPAPPPPPRSELAVRFHIGTSLVTSKAIPQGRTPRSSGFRVSSYMVFLINFQFWDKGVNKSTVIIVHYCQHLTQENEIFWGRQKGRGKKQPVSPNGGR